MQRAGHRCLRAARGSDRRNGRRVACAMPAELVEALGQTATASGPCRGLSDVDNRCTVHPRNPGALRFPPRVLALEPAGRTRSKKRRLVTALAHDDVHALSPRHSRRRQFTEPNKTLNPAAASPSRDQSIRSVWLAMAARVIPARTGAHTIRPSLGPSCIWRTEVRIETPHPQA
jgi:hypothetical protein